MKALTNDARNRALRSLITGLALDIAVGVALVLLNTFVPAQSWGDIDWKVLGFLVAKSVVQAAAAFVLRRFVDGSKVPTPLPPEPVPAPNEDQP